MAAATAFGLAAATGVMMTPLRAQETEGQTSWPSYNLDLAGSRYSELDAINTANVGQLELAWSLKAEAENVITQVTPLVVNGVMYFNDATGNVFAVDPATGEALWTTELGDDTSRIVSRPRGPSYGDGQLYAFFGVTMFALDAATGDLVESFGNEGRLEIVTEALHFKYPDQYPQTLDARTLGHQITTPPTYYQDTLYVGVGLSDQHIPGGLLIAANATTGAINWVFNTVPQGPNDGGWEIAKDTWGTGIRAGGGIWTTPAIDAELGLVYVNTGNPSADYDGSARPGINLFTNATLAIELETGRLAWYFQTLHHDVWDLDHVTGPLLFDAKQDGRTVRGVAASGKNCLLYIWDRATGEPVNPIVEMAVPTETDVPGEQIWPTQPFPYTARGVPMSPFCNTYPIVGDPEARRMSRQIYTPYSMTEPYVLAHGGSNWGSPSFSPRTGLLYITARDNALSLTVKPVGDRVEIGQGRGGATSTETRRGGHMTPTATLTAYEPVSGELVWQHRAESVPVRLPGTGGSLVTAGDVIFQGTHHGVFYGLDAYTGKELFAYEHNRFIRASPMTYQIDGTQYVSVVGTDTILTFALP